MTATKRSEEEDSVQTGRDHDQAVRDSDQVVRDVPIIILAVLAMIPTGDYLYSTELFGGIGWFLAVMFIVLLVGFIAYLVRGLIWLSKGK